MEGLNSGATLPQPFSGKPIIEEGYSVTDVRIETSNVTIPSEKGQFKIKLNQTLTVVKQSFPIQPARCGTKTPIHHSKIASRRGCVALLSP